ncbi:MAG: YceI family protein [Bdellovibrionota bacterium]|nr:YceI family protein [Deltaproteobacteria bacterium]
MNHKQPKLLFLMFLFCLLPGFTHAEQIYELSKKSQITFTAHITGGSFVTKAKKIEGLITLSDNGSQIIHAEIIVPVQNLDSGISLRNSHMHEKYLEASHHPDIIFEIKDPIDFSTSPFTAKGAFKIKGITKQEAMEFSWKNVSDQKIEIESEFPMIITDYGIPQPGFAVVKMDPKIDVRVSLILELKK